MGYGFNIQVPAPDGGGRNGTGELLRVSAGAEVAVVGCGAPML